MIIEQLPGHTSLSSSSIAIVWFRRDLRLRDNPALATALDQFDQIIPLYVWDDNAGGAGSGPEDAYHQPGAASKVWLHHSLAALSADIANLGSRLILRRGPVQQTLSDLVRESGATAIYCNELHEPHLAQRDAELKSMLQSNGVTCESFNGNYLRRPTDGCKADGTPYKVFTAYARAFERDYEAQVPGPDPNSLPEFSGKLHSCALDQLDLLPRLPWADDMMDGWQAGEAGATKAWAAFKGSGLSNYEETRNLPADDDGVSRMSPHLHFGEISPRALWTDVNKARQSAPAKAARDSAAVYGGELIWREFACHLLHHFPQMPESPLRQEFEQMPWWGTETYLTAWQRGLTGYPIVDAGMRQLWHTGWMHNRVRMIVGSFLVKDLGLPWQAGEAWFWDTLVDADLAQNAMNWQWVAGCGVDASPWFRIFNPVSQGQKFDPDGDYVKTWVPELACVPTKWIHQPWLAPPEHRPAAYPQPIVDHTVARAHALSAYKKLKQG